MKAAIDVREREGGREGGREGECECVRVCARVYVRMLRDVDVSVSVFSDEVIDKTDQRTS